ncbi:AfsA-related hotdog domain-containing protein [Streptomyces sp. NPDC041068]|uniref:AfsA-related hotdog domain-containing protein n=1 Tax=Streptomyces sp. NPDC041068 TaxID=3155130 RepID=UPI0033F84E28
MKEKAILREWSRGSTGATARLVVDKEDPFFFDHALDHVPGILVIAGLLDLIRTQSAEPRPDGRIKVSLDFAKFCEPDDDITVSVSPSAAGTEEEPAWELAATVGTSTAVSGTAVLHHKSAERFVPAAPEQRGEGLAAAELAHRERPENALLGAAWWADDRLFARAQRPPVGHPLRTRPLVELIESARQFVTLIGHAGYERPIGDKFILCALEVDIPLGLAPGEVSMEWVRKPVDGRRYPLTARLFRSSGDDLDEEVGSARFDTMIVNPRQYQTIRFRRRHVEERAI